MSIKFKLKKKTHILDIASFPLPRCRNITIAHHDHIVAGDYFLKDPDQEWKGYCIPCSESYLTNKSIELLHKSIGSRSHLKKKRMIALDKRKAFRLKSLKLVARSFTFKEIEEKSHQIDKECEQEWAERLEHAKSKLIHPTS